MNGPIPYLWLRRATPGVNVVSSVGMLFLNPHPFYPAVMVSMFGTQSLQGLVLPFLLVPPVLLIGCIVFSINAARRGWRISPAVATLPLLAAAVWQFHAWQHPNG